MSKKLKFNVKYVVVKISPHNMKQLERFEFDDVHEAVNKHIDMDREIQGGGSYWDLIVEYRM